MMRRSAGWICGGVSTTLIVFSLFPAGTFEQCVQVVDNEEKCRVDMWRCLNNFNVFLLFPAGTVEQCVQVEGGCVEVSQQL